VGCCQFEFSFDKNDKRRGIRTHSQQSDLLTRHLVSRRNKDEAGCLFECEEGGKERRSAAVSSPSRIDGFSLPDDAELTKQTAICLRIKSQGFSMTLSTGSAYFLLDERFPSSSYSTGESHERNDKTRRTTRQETI